jgi:hypothetical protein
MNAQRKRIGRRQSDGAAGGELDEAEVGIGRVE